MYLKLPLDVEMFQHTFCLGDSQKHLSVMLRSEPAIALVSPPVLGTCLKRKCEIPAAYTAAAVHGAVLWA